MTHSPREGLPLVRLSRSFDAALLERDLEAVLASHPPLPQNSPLEVLRDQLGIPWGDDSVYDALRETWTALSLRAQGGDWRLVRGEERSTVPYLPDPPK